MEITYKRVDELVEYEGNARRNDAGVGMSTLFRTIFIRSVHDIRLVFYNPKSHVNVCC